MENLDVKKIDIKRARESLKKEGKIIQNVEYVWTMNETNMAFLKAERELRNAIRDIFEMYPDQDVRDYVCAACRYDMLIMSDIYIETLKERLTKRVNRMIEKSQKQEAE